MSDVKQILDSIEQDKPNVAEKLLPLLYDELRRLAAYHLSREKPGQTLQATALVHEAYMRLVKSEGPEWNGHKHFFFAAARAMRRILTENARRKKSVKHGGHLKRVDTDNIEFPTAMRPEEILALDEALIRLQAIDSQAAELITLHFYAGFTLEQIADILGISRRTAYSIWEFARSWLYREVRNS